jgi:hypothetical protein
MLGVPVVMGSPALTTVATKAAMSASIPPMMLIVTMVFLALTTVVIPAPVVKMLPIMLTVIMVYGVTEKRPVMRSRTVRPELLPIVTMGSPAPMTVAMKAAMFVSIPPMTPTVTMVSIAMEPRPVMPSRVVRKELRLLATMGLPVPMIVVMREATVVVMLLIIAIVTMVFSVPELKFVTLSPAARLAPEILVRPPLYVTKTLIAVPIALTTMIVMTAKIVMVTRPV